MGLGFGLVFEVEEVGHNVLLVTLPAHGYISGL